MIARNLRKYAEALALQLPLPFGRRLRQLKQARPTTRAARAARAARAGLRRAILAVRVIYPVRRQPAPRRAKVTNSAQQMPLCWLKLDHWDAQATPVRVWAYA